MDKIIFVFVFALFLFSGCHLRDKSDKIKKSIGRHEFNYFLTTPDLLEKVKYNPPVLYLYDDMTFEIKSKIKYCFSGIKGKWGVTFDSEGEYYGGVSNYQMENILTDNQKFNS